MKNSKKNDLFETPILFLIYNRLELTEKVFQCIREIKPKYLYVAADGPKDQHQDLNKCDITRKIVLNNIDWECEIKTLFLENNLGCGKAVSKAITWFFDQVEMGIILEDDVLPNLTFFGFCEELLEYYSDDSEIMHISGGCYLPDRFFNNESYYFTKYPFIWGWATWRRAWSYFKYEIGEMDVDSEHYDLSEIEINYWQQIKESILKDELDTWGFRWNFSIWKMRALAISSTINLVQNIGFSEDSTHTKQINYYYRKIKLQKAGKYMIHPEERIINKMADRKVFKRYNLMQIDFVDKILNKISNGRF